MGFRFWKRVRLAPGLTLNLSASALSLSVGPRGAKYTVGTRGQRATVGLPGTGLYYTTALGAKKKRRSGGSRPAPVAPDPGFFERLFIPAGEEALIDGCRAFVAGDEPAALKHLERATHLADGAFLAGFCALRAGDAKAARRHWQQALTQSDRLGQQLGKHGLRIEARLAITPEVEALIAPDRSGVLLCLVEAEQQLGAHKAALEHLMTLRRLQKDDLVWRISAVELLMEGTADRDTLKQVLDLSTDVSNESALQAALLLYRGRALHRLELLDAARALLTKTLRRRKGRPDELLWALRYERAMVYQALGRAREARRDWERLYAENPAYEDIAQRLGL